MCLCRAKPAPHRGISHVNKPGTHQDSGHPMTFSCLYVDKYCPHSPQHCSNLSSKLTPARLLQRLHYLLSLRENRGHQPSIPSIPHFEPYLILAPCLISHLRENLVRPQSTITRCLPPLPFPSEICFIDNQLPLSYYNLSAISFFLLH